MNDDIGKVVSECLNDRLIKHYVLKTKNMTYNEKKKQENNMKAEQNLKRRHLFVWVRIPC